MSLPRIMVAPNGARLKKSDHPGIPLTLDEIATCAVACQTEGAGGLHLHLRDDQGCHLLDWGAYADALSVLREHCPKMQVQITTEAAGRYGPEVQRDVGLRSGARMISASVREICRDSRAAPEFYRACHAAGIAVQHILYDTGDAEALHKALGPELFGDPSLQLIFVLGRHTVGQVSRPADLDPFLTWLSGAGIAPDWAVCAFGPHESDCLLYAARAGGKCRIGFENSLFNRDGSIAHSNAERVRELRQMLDQAGLLPAATQAAA